MNTSSAVRIAAVAASACITLALFSGVASLAEPPQTDAGTQLAAARSTAAVTTGRHTRVVAGNTRRPKQPV